MNRRTVSSSVNECSRQEIVSENDEFQRILNKSGYALEKAQNINGNISNRVGQLVGFSPCDPSATCGECKTPESFIARMDLMLDSIEWNLNRAQDEFSRL